MRLAGASYFLRVDFRDTSQKANVRDPSRKAEKYSSTSKDRDTASGQGSSACTWAHGREAAGWMCELRAHVLAPRALGTLAEPTYDDK